METLVQVSAVVPRELKRQAFAVLAMRDQRFNHWLRSQMEHLLEETKGADENVAIVAGNRPAVRRSE